MQTLYSCKHYEQNNNNLNLTCTCQRDKKRCILIGGNNFCFNYEKKGREENGIRSNRS